MKNSWKIMMAFVLLLCVPLAAQVRVKEVRTHFVSPGDGKALYETYCASCHGIDMKGMAVVRQNATANINLTRISTKSPTTAGTRVAARLHFGPKMQTEPICMPEWYPILRNQYHGNGNWTAMAIRNLTDYIVSHQQ